MHSLPDLRHGASRESDDEAAPLCDGPGSGGGNVLQPEEEQQPYIMIAGNQRAKQERLPAGLY